MEMKEAMRVLGEITPGQWGLVTTAQAATVDVDTVTLTRLVEAGLLQWIRRGVYAVAAADPTSHQEIKAAWLALNPAAPGWDRQLLDPDGGVISHTSAALLWELGDLVTDRIEITVPRRRDMRDRAVRLRRQSLTDSDVVQVDGLPATTLERTVLDLLDDHTDASHLGQILADAHQHHGLDLDCLADRAGPYARRYGIPGRNGHALLDYLLDHVVERASRAERALSDLIAHTLRTTPKVGLSHLHPPGDIRALPTIRVTLPDLAHLPAADDRSANEDA